MNVPSGYTALDLIGFTDRGDYDSTANYVKNDLVHHNNSIWRCLVDDTTAVTPAEGANWTVYIQNGTTLNGMADVNLTTPANGDLLRYNSTSSKWENQDVDSTPTQSSTKLVQSGGVYTQLANKANTADLATVATSGAYSDLSGTPQLAAVATSGAYSDLTGQPTIPTVNDATLTIQKNGTNVETFTANSSTNKTANITVPDVINDLSDVNISSVANEEILAYDSTSSKWKNSGALGALKETLTNHEKQNAKNMCVNNLLASGSYRGFTFTPHEDGSITFDGTTTGSAFINITLVDFNDGFSHDSRKYSCEELGLDITKDIWMSLGSATAVGVDMRLYCYTSNDASDYLGYIATSASAVKNIATSYPGTKYVSFGVGAPKGTTANNVTVYPMVYYNSEIDKSYVPYAMTNQQLTDVATEIIGNCVVKLNQRVSVTADGVKTYQTLFNELASSLVSVCQGLADDEIVMPKYFFEGVIERTFLCDIPFPSDNTTTSMGRRRFTGMFMNTTTAVLYRIDISSTLNDCSYITTKINSSSTTFIDDTQSVPASGKSFRIYYDIYKTV